MFDLKQWIAKATKMMTLDYDEYTVGTTGKVEARRSGHVVTVLIYSHTGKAYSAGAWTTLCTIGEQYRPATRPLAIIYDNSSSTAAKLPMVARIEPTGEVQIWHFSDNGASTTPCGTIVYLI